MLIGAAVAIGILFILVVAVIISLAAGGAAVVNEIDNNIQEEQLKIEKDVNTLKVENIKQVGDKIEGTITNTLDYNIDYLAIDFKFFDKEKVTISDGMANKTNFAVGEVWKFEIYLIETDFESYEYELDMSVY